MEKINFSKKNKLLSKTFNAFVDKGMFDVNIKFSSKSLTKTKQGKNKFKIFINNMLQ